MQLCISFILSPLLRSLWIKEQKLGEEDDDVEEDGEENFSRLNRQLQPFPRAVLCYCTNWRAPMGPSHCTPCGRDAERILRSCALQGSIIPWSGAKEWPGLTFDPLGFVVSHRAFSLLPVSPPWLFPYFLTSEGSWAGSRGKIGVTPHPRGGHFGRRDAQKRLGVGLAWNTWHIPECAVPHLPRVPKDHTGCSGQK